MKEAFVQYLWQRQSFERSDLYTVQNEKVLILNPGDFTGVDGPDFFNAQLYLNNQLWVGNVEIHLKSSDWFIHRHELDERYANVVLHVVWEYDVPVLRKDGTELSVLEIKRYVDRGLVEKCEQLFITKKRFNCEHGVESINDFVWFTWKERLFIERLESKTKPIFNLLKKCKNDWQYVFICFLAKGFGTNVNGEFFMRMMLELPPTILYKHSDNLLQLEALFFGICGFLEMEDDGDDSYCKALKLEWKFLKAKYQLNALNKNQIQFFQLRPSNFPTIRIAQLAAWFHQNSFKINDLLFLEDITKAYPIFSVSISDYWQTHYVFNNETKMSKKRLSNNFIESIYINVIVPMQYAYSRFNNEEQEGIDQLIDVLLGLKPEFNSVITSFEKIGVVANNAFDSQALIELKKNYCNLNNCLNCQIGKSLLTN